MNERTKFIEAYLEGYYTVTELSARFGVSRKTGYKWVERFKEDGRVGLKDRSRAPLHCPHRIAPAIAERILDAKRKHPDWGPGILLGWLATRDPKTPWPAISTAGDLLARHGLVQKRRRRRPQVHPGVVPPVTKEPNDLWTADFKGQFKTRDGEYCYPLTIADLHTRYLLSCQGLRSIKREGAHQVFERAFQTYGLPKAIRTDNGVPFATTSIHGLSRLNVWWLRLGIQHQRIQPASPQQNGAHERMHKTLKRGAIRPPRANLASQQRAFNAFRALYNDERPHRALNGQPPTSRYASSPREYPRRLPPQEYPGHFLVKKITTGGTFRFKHRLLFIANPLVGHQIGLEEIDDGIWAIYFNAVLLAKLDERDFIIRE